MKTHVNPLGFQPALEEQATQIHGQGVDELVQQYSHV